METSKEFKLTGLSVPIPKGPCAQRVYTWVYYLGTWTLKVLYVPESVNFRKGSPIAYP